jgi:hypothetical protein
MVQFPSKLSFAAFLQYRPDGADLTAILSRDVTYAIKQDKFVSSHGRQLPVIPYTADRIRDELANHAFLAKYFDSQSVLVPVPRSSLIQPGTLWPSRRICESLVAVGLGARVECYIERRFAIPKAATAGPGGRAMPDLHFQSTNIVRQKTFAPLSSITLIDDVITRGSTFVGIYPHFESAFPGIPIRCFAVVRSMRFKEITQILSPVEGVIGFAGGDLRREP